MGIYTNAIIKICRDQKQYRGKGDRFRWEVLREGLVEKMVPDRLLGDEQAVARWTSEESYRKRELHMKRHSRRNT